MQQILHCHGFFAPPFRHRLPRHLLCFAPAQGILRCNFGPTGEYAAKDGENFDRKFAKMHTNFGTFDLGNFNFKKFILYFLGRLFPRIVGNIPPTAWPFQQPRSICDDARFV